MGLWSTFVGIALAGRLGNLVDLPPGRLDRADHPHRVSFLLTRPLGRGSRSLSKGQ